MISSFISQMPEQAATFILLGLLVLAFVVAFKVLKMVMETVLITVISAGFYTAMVFAGLIQGFEFNQMLFFSFLGSGLYLFYSVLASTYTVLSKMIAVPYKLVLVATIPFKHGYRTLRAHWSPPDLREKVENWKPDSYEEEIEDQEYDTKEVVLDKLNKEEE